MKNYWVQTESAIATWCIDVRPALGNPRALVELARVIAELGRETGVLLRATEPVEGQADPCDVAEVPAADEWTLPLCRGHGWDDADALLAWYATGGELVDGRVADLGALLRSLEPVPHSIPSGLMSIGDAPLALHGPRLRYSGDRHSLELAPVTTTISISTHSDIWFPFVVGAAHPWADFERRFDNRDLAGRHTPRLNRFVMGARQATAAAGCLWSVEATESNSLYVDWIGLDGVLLDSAAPALMPEGAADVVWQPL